MNVKLEVIRMVNDDVIATSGLCSHLNAIKDNDSDHLYVTGHAAGVYYFATKYTHGDKLTYGDSSAYDSNYFVSTPEVNTWYFWNGTKYEKCEEQSNAAHPISKK